MHPEPVEAATESTQRRFMSPPLSVSCDSLGVSAPDLQAGAHGRNEMRRRRRPSVSGNDQHLGTDMPVHRPGASRPCQAAAWSRAAPPRARFRSLFPLKVAAIEERRSDGAKNYRDS